MPNIFFTSDHHFGHENIIKFCNRPFSSIEGMDKNLITNWNDAVENKDIVYHLGDFTLKGFDEFSNYCSQLNGNIHIIPGGHDYRWLNTWKKLYRIEDSIDTRTGSCFVREPLISLEFPDLGKNGYPQTIVLCHYAMRVWDRSHYGSWHLYGHSHGNLVSHEKSFDVGVDINNFIPISLEEVQERML